MGIDEQINRVSTIPALGKRVAVFLDRDGVLNRAVVRDGHPFPPSALDEVEILPGVAQALARLRGAGYLLIVVTNQPDVARGTARMEDVEAINREIGAQLPLDEFCTCYHDSSDGCDCRKPRPGALIAAGERHGIDLARSYMIGDRWRDVEAGRSAGCVTFFIDYGYAERKPVKPDFRVASLSEAASIILNGI